MEYLNVVHVIAPENLGGAESVVRRFAEITYANGRNVTVIAIIPNDTESPFVENLRHKGIPVKVIHCKKRHYLAEIYSLARLFIEIRPDLVHTHLYHADVIGYFAARKCGLPIVSTVHGFTGTGVRSRLYVWLDKLLLKRFDAVVCVSKGLCTIMQRVGCKPERLYLIKNCYDAPESEPSNSIRNELKLPLDKHCIGWVGRLSIEKGADLFVKSIACINREDVIGVLIGDGPERKKVEEIAENLGIKHRIKFLGLHNDASRLFPAFDVFVLSSRSEANPMVIFEAVWSVVPVVAFRVGDIEDMIDESMATLVESGNILEMAKAVEDVIDNHERFRLRSGKTLDMMRERFSASRWLSEKYDMYNKIVKRN